MCYSKNHHIFLISPPDIDVFEIKFGYEFCKKYLKKYIGKELEIITGEEKLKDLHLKSNIVFFIFDSTCIPAKKTKERLLQAIEEGYDLAVPVSNESIYEAQKASFPFVYHNITTFNEVSDNLTKDIVPIDKVDPFFFILNTKKISQNTKIKDIPELNISKCIVKNAVVHRFENVFSSPREDIISLIPDSCKEILDIGCAQGQLGKYLKQIRPHIQITGIELSPSLAHIAKQHYDEVFVQDIEKITLKKQFDAVICGDILEHLYNPWKTIETIYNWTRHGGYFIASVPNISHYSILQDLLQARFEYIPIGLLCVGHIRFFTEQSLKEILLDTGFSIDVWQRQTVEPTPKGKEFISKIKDLANIEQLKTFSFLFRAKKSYA